MLKQKSIFIIAIIMSMFFIYGCNNNQNSIVLRTMGSLFFGGTVETLEDGDTFHGEHGYAQYYIPQNSYNYPIIMWHGMGQSGRSFESTPDGREGYMAMLPRRNWAVYIIDQPRRGRAGRTRTTLENSELFITEAYESETWNAFRNGIWKKPNKPYLYEGVQFPSDPDSIEQFFRQQTPNTGIEPYSSEYEQFMGRTMADLLKRTGPAILMTHSAGGPLGWTTGLIAEELIKAIVAYEPGDFIFPEGEEIEYIESPLDYIRDNYNPKRIPTNEFIKLTKFPILVVWGDNISTEPTNEVFNEEFWRVASIRAKQFVDTINKYGGDATLVMLPEIGIKGNTHAPFADLNNEEIANHLIKFLHEKKLDIKDNPHTGPAKHGLTEYTIPLDR